MVKENDGILNRQSLLSTVYFHSYQKRLIFAKVKT